MPDSLTLADLAALRARYTSPPDSCPVCGTPRCQEFEPEDSVQHWTCPAVPQGPQFGSYTEGGFEGHWADYHAAFGRWADSPEGQAARFIENASWILPVSTGRGKEVRPSGRFPPVEYLLYLKRETDRRLEVASHAWPGSGVAGDVGTGERSSQRH